MSPADLKALSRSIEILRGDAADRLRKAGADEKDDAYALWAAYDAAAMHLRWKIVNSGGGG